MSDGLSLRRYRPADRDQVLELHEVAMRQEGAYVEEVPDPDLEDIEASYLEAGGEFLVGSVEASGEGDPEIVAIGAYRPATGYITEVLEDLDPAAATAEIKRMRVDPARQRRGYGQRIYEELERQARERGFTELVLDSMPKQTAARGLFEANDFEVVRRKRLETAQEVFDLLFYRKSVSGDS